MCKETQQNAVGRAMATEEFLQRFTSLHCSGEILHRERDRNKSLGHSRCSLGIELRPTEKPKGRKWRISPKAEPGLGR